ncbi:MAG TPA: GtrA family protein [Bradyrhizobium sp.]
MKGNTGGAHGGAMQFVSRLLQDLYQNDQLKIVRYFFAGVVVSIGYTITVVVLVEYVGWTNPSLASATSFLVWTPISYYAHRDFTFGFEGGNSAASAKYVISFLLRFAASVVVVAVAVHLKWHYIVGVFFNWGMLPLVNYFVLHFWVFRDRSPSAPVGQNGLIE